MNSGDGVMDVSTLNFEGDFDTQVEDVMLHVRLTANEVQALRCLFRDLEHALQGLGPGLEVMPFGSIVTGLGVKTSDVDCYVALPHGVECGNNIVFQARNRLQKHYKKFTNVFAIGSAKVPIVKFLHIPTNCNCDVNFQSPAGVYNSELIGKLLHMDTDGRVLRLAILIKYWSKVHKITGTNLLASYALTLMVIFYLQLMNILPSIYEMQKSVPPHIVNGWDMTFDKSISSKSNNHESLYSLMSGFFKCYANLNFEENIICPFLGRLIHKKQFVNLDSVPEPFELYKNNVSANICKPLKFDTPMCIQDPFEHARNTSVAVYPKLAARIKALFQFAARKFEEVPPSSFLKAIYTEGPPIVIENQKDKRKHTFQNKIRKPMHNPPQKKHGLFNKFNLMKCYQQINGKNRPQKK